LLAIEGHLRRGRQESVERLAHQVLNLAAGEGGMDPQPDPQSLINTGCELDLHKSSPFLLLAF
jgi:hypothetical protein